MTLAGRRARERYKPAIQVQVCWANFICCLPKQNIVVTSCDVLE